MPWVQKRWVSQTEPDIQTMPWVPKKGECHRLYLTFRLCLEFQKKVSVTDCTWHSDYALSSKKRWVSQTVPDIQTMRWVQKRSVADYTWHSDCRGFQKGECHRDCTWHLDYALSSKKKEEKKKEKKVSVTDYTWHSDYSYLIPPWVPKKGECHRLYLTFRLCTEFKKCASCGIQTINLYIVRKQLSQTRVWHSD